VRVAVLVEVNRKQYSSSPWTEWVGVTEGKDEPTTEKGEVKPTTAGGIIILQCAALAIDLSSYLQRGLKI
jgi:hypothetical protein